MRAHRPQVLSVLVAAGLLALLWSRADDDPEADRNAMIGTWTDPDGPPGNAIRFYFVPVEIPGAPYATAYEGHVTLEHFLGHEKSHGSWGYGGWDPLTLNVTVGRRPLFVAIRKLDEDHLLVRFGTDGEKMYRADALDHPDARVLTRIGRESADPFNGGPE